MKSLDEILRMDNPSEYLYEYAERNGRLEPKWEELLLSLGDPHWLYRYATDIIKRRWGEAEEHIKKDPEYAYCYIINIIKGRWEKAEEYIMRDPHWWRLYYEYFNIEEYDEIT